MRFNKLLEIIKVVDNKYKEYDKEFHIITIQIVKNQFLHFYLPSNRRKYRKTGYVMEQIVGTSNKKGVQDYYRKISNIRAVEILKIHFDSKRDFYEKKGISIRDLKKRYLNY